MRLLAFALLVCFTASDSFANFVLVARLTRQETAAAGFNRTWGTGSGGEFAMELGRVAVGGSTVQQFTQTSTNNLRGDLFLGNFYKYNTFCLEDNEFINLNQWYKVAGDSYLDPTGSFAGLGNEAVTAYAGRTRDTNGTASGNSAGDFDPVDSGTRNRVWDYFTGTRNDANANTLQQEIWRNEGNAAGSDNDNPALLTSGGAKTVALNLFQFNAATNYAGGATQYDNDLLSFEAIAGVNDSLASKLLPYVAQSQIAISLSLGQTPPEVPEPATFALFGMGALAAGFYRARRGSKKA